MPKHALIFKDILGTLAGERAGLDPQVTPDVRFRDPVDSSRPNWRELDRVLPPRPPAADNLLHTTLSTINDDILFSIFGSYRLVNPEKWNLQRRWCPLIYVCKRWRRLIYESPSHLDLHILCTNGTPVADMLKHSPPLPLIIDYQNTCAAMTTEDEEGILHALQHHRRVRRIVLHAPPQGLHKFLTAMNENFLTLERLSILSTSGDDPMLVMPGAFQAARLSHLTLLGVTLSAEPQSLPTTVSRVSLALTNLQAFPHLPPEDLAAQLQFDLSLGELSISFSAPIPHSRIQRGIESPMTRTTLLALMRFVSQHVSAYLEGLLARTSATSLRKFDVTLFNQFIYELPVLSSFIDATAKFRFPVTKIHFNRDCFSIFMSDNREEEAQGNRSLHVQVRCEPFDQQVSSAAQICKTLWWMLAAAEELAIDFHEHVEFRNEVDRRRTWCDLLEPFTGVKKLRVGRAVTLDLSRALKPAEGQPGTGGGMPVRPSSLLLYELQELVLEEGCDHNAFTAFIDTRQRVGRPIVIL
ncbi:hypothetical protein V8E52_010710 [Russula decolorans]